MVISSGIRLARATALGVTGLVALPVDDETTGRSRSWAALVLEVGTRQKNQPAPPSAVFEALTQPHRDPSRAWLALLHDEHQPEVVEVDEPHLVVWSSLWEGRPDARVRFDLPHGARGQGTDLRWTLLVEEPAPEPPLLGHLCERLNELINASLRYSFGQ